MAKSEYPQRHSWWLNELESLGVNTREEIYLKDPKRTSELTMDIKQMFYEEYKKAFSEGGFDHGLTDLNDYLKLNSKVIVHLVNKKYVPAKMTKEPTFEALAEILQGIFIVRYGSEIGTRDQAHNVLAMAIIYSMWCGGLSQTKTNRGGYTKELADRFKKLIADAFDGQNYSNDQP